MKVSSLAVTLVVAAFVCAIAGAPVKAQQAMHPVTETKGLFTVSFPEGWTVLQLPLDQASESAPGQNPGPVKLQAIMVAAAPGNDPQALVMVFAYILPRPVSAFDWWLAAGIGLRKQFPESQVIKEGIGKIGEREVYYRHFTWRSEPDSTTYSVMVMFSASTTGLMFVGSTSTDPDRVQQYVPLFLQIAETLLPQP